MKLRKILSAATAAALCAGALIVNASAAQFDLTMPVIDIGVTSAEWFTNGTDEKESDLTLEILGSATQLVIELAAELNEDQISGGSGVVVLFGDGQAWDWNAGTNNYTLAEVVDGNKLVFNISGMNGFNEILAGPNAKIAWQNWYPDFDEMQVVRCYLEVADSATDTASTADAAATTDATPTAGDVTAVSTADKGSADTGVEGVAVIAGLAILAAGAAVISKKRK